jgi:surface antigen
MAGQEGCAVGSPPPVGAGSEVEGERQLIGPARAPPASDTVTCGLRIARPRAATAANENTKATVDLAVGAVGRAMNDADQRCVAWILEQACDRSAVGWRNPNTGVSYQVTPVKTFTSMDGLRCRVYRIEASLGDEPRKVYASACQHQGGEWRLVSAPRN